MMLSNTVTIKVPFPALFKCASIPLNGRKGRLFIGENGLRRLNGIKYTGIQTEKLRTVMQDFFEVDSGEN
jgi:hypothetical protein